MTFLVVAMFILSSVDYGSFWAYVRRAFIEHGETNQTIADSLEEYPNWFIGLTIAPDINAIIADSIIVSGTLLVNSLVFLTIRWFRFGAVGSSGVDYGKLPSFQQYVL
jgi:hypothetical protein